LIKRLDDAAGSEVAGIFASPGEVSLWRLRVKSAYTATAGCAAPALTGNIQDAVTVDTIPITASIANIARTILRSLASCSA